MSSRLSAPVESIMRGESRFSVGTTAGREPGGDNDAIEGQDSSRAIGFRYTQCGGVLKSSSALNVLHLALFRKHAQSTGQFLDHVLLERAKAGEINLWRSELDSPVLRLMGLLQQFGHMQQRFRRNASAIKAYAARDSLRDR